MICPHLARIGRDDLAGHSGIMPILDLLRNEFSKHLFWIFSIQSLIYSFRRHSHRPRTPG